MPFDSENYQPIPEGHRRLLVLAEFLETKVPASAFDLSDWNCGTSACAVGWATTIPEFRLLGLRLRTDKGQSHLYPILWESGTLAPLIGWDAVCVIFDINEFQADGLFEIGSYEELPTPRSVAANIRTFVAEQAKVTA